MTIAAAVAVAVLSHPVAAADEFGERLPAPTVLFGSLEAGSTKAFLAIGMKRAVGGAGLDVGGIRTLVKIGLSREQAFRSAPHGIAHKAEIQSLIGYEWRIGDSFIALYAGLDSEGEQRPCGCRVIATARFGQRVQADLWATPLPQAMLQASAYASTIDRTLWGRAAAGWTLRELAPRSSVLNGAYLGPEAEFYNQPGYHKLRLGLHLTGLRLFGLSWRLAGGLQRSSDRPAQAYATLGLHWRQ